MPMRDKMLSASKGSCEPILYANQGRLCLRSLIL